VRATGHTRRKIIANASAFNLDQCEVCGTNNPTMPGESPAEKCSGCGTELPRATWTVRPQAFTPPKKPEQEREAAICIKESRARRAIRQANRDAARLAARLHFPGELRRGCGIKKPQDRKNP